MVVTSMLSEEEGCTRLYWFIPSYNCAFHAVFETVRVLGFIESAEECAWSIARLVDAASNVFEDKKIIVLIKYFIIKGGMCQALSP